MPKAALVQGGQTDNTVTGHVPGLNLQSSVDLAKIKTRFLDAFGCFGRSLPTVQPVQSSTVSTVPFDL